MKDTMIPTKAEDYEPAIQTDKKYLLSEVDRLLQKKRGDKMEGDDVDHFLRTRYAEHINPDTGDAFTFKVWEPQPHGAPENWFNIDKDNKKAKCTCPKVFQSKKRAKKKNWEPMYKVTNGYQSRCPIHPDKK